MRLWSLHPSYLDTRGLVALWREALLAKHVLEGRTKGYKNHPQLDRFKKAARPIDTINHYLSEVYIAATERGYNFDRQKIDWSFEQATLIVTRGQMNYETRHLLNKLKQRDEHKYRVVADQVKVKPHPMFRVVRGNVEAWEVTK